jgi:hypothetical protein
VQYGTPKLIDKAKWLQTLFLDAQLVTSIERGAAKGETRALQMGYQRLGLMRDGEFLGEATPKPAPDTMPLILNAAVMPEHEAGLADPMEEPEYLL